MSSTVSLDLVLISSKNLLPRDRMISVLNDCLAENNASIKDDVLIVNGKNIGKIFIKDRIIVKTDSDYSSYVNDIANHLRNSFTRRAEIEFIRYQEELNEKKKLLEEQQNISLAIKKELERINTEISSSIDAKRIQSLSPCEAIVEELKLAAYNQGYEIEEERNDSGFQLQFVRRVY